MAVMRAIAEGGLGLDWSKETAVDEAMQRQGGLRLHDTLRKIKDYAPPPPDESSEESEESESGSEETRGDTDEENLLFSDDDCVMTSGDEEDSDEEETKSSRAETEAVAAGAPPAPSAAEILAARKAVISAVAKGRLGGQAIQGVPAIGHRATPPAGQPPSMPARIDSAKTAKNAIAMPVPDLSSKLPPIGKTAGVQKDAAKGGLLRRR
jgi:hypothetical protein